MRNVRSRRRGIIDLHVITIGDWIVLLAAFFAVIALFMPWFVSNLPGGHSQWAFTYSAWSSVVVLLFFFATVFLVIYPALSPDLGLPPLPFSSGVILLLIGVILLLDFTYEFGKYGCVLCQGITRGFGVYVALIAAIFYIVGAIVKWGSRPARTH